MRDLLVILPVRRRPHNLPRFLGAFRRTAKTADLLIVMDSDDRSYDGKLTRLGVGGEGRIHAVVQERMMTSPKVNRVALQHTGAYRALMFMGDDNVPRTPGWDLLMLQALDEMGGTGILYARDLARDDLPCSALISAGIVAALGWMALPAVSHFFMDNAWRDLGTRAGCLRYLPDVVIEHLHPAWGKAPTDALYDGARREYWDADEKAYATWRERQMEADVAKVRGLIT